MLPLLPRFDSTIAPWSAVAAAPDPRLFRSRAWGVNLDEHESAAGRATIRNRRLGLWLLPRQRPGAARCPRRSGRTRGRPLLLDRPPPSSTGPAARAAAVSPDPRFATPRDLRCLRERNPGVRLRGAVPRRVPDQGEPAERRGRGTRPVRPQAGARARGGQQGRARGGPGPAAGPERVHHLQRIQGQALRAPGSPRRGLGQARLHDHREAAGDPADPRRRARDGHPAPDRHADPSAGSWLGQVGEVRGIRSEVRPEHAGTPRRRGPAPDRGPTGLLPTAPLPRGQPDPRDPRDQGRREGGRARVREARQDRLQHEGPGRGRRARRRLRRERHLLRGQHELLGAGVRQRRRVQRPGGLRGRGRSGPDAHQRVGPGVGGVSRDADHGGERADGVRRGWGDPDSRGRARRRPRAARRSSTASTARTTASTCTMPRPCARVCWATSTSGISRFGTGR